MYTVYLAGPIKGLSYKDCVSWRNTVDAALKPEITCFCPMRGKNYLEKQTSIQDQYLGRVLSTGKGILSRDSFDVKRCDLMFVYLLEADKVSIGTVLEIGMAYVLQKPIVIVMNKGNIHDHSMLKETTGFIVDNLKDAIEVTRSILLP